MLANHDDCKMSRRLGIRRVRKTLFYIYFAPTIKGDLNASFALALAIDVLVFAVLTILGLLINC